MISYFAIIEQFLMHYVQQSGEHCVKNYFHADVLPLLCQGEHCDTHKVMNSSTVFKCAEQEQ